MTFSALLLLWACSLILLAWHICLQAEVARLLQKLRERSVTSPEETVSPARLEGLAVCFSHAALGQPQPLLSIPSPSGSSQTMSRVHIPSLTTWGLGKCLYFGVSQKYIFVQSAEEWSFFFREDWGILIWG